MTRYRVYTETGSVHEIDSTERTYVRLRAGSGTGELRRDGEPIPMLAYALGQPGEICILALMVREDGVTTMRTTSPVVRIEEQN